MIRHAVLLALLIVTFSASSAWAEVYVLPPDFVQSLEASKGVLVATPAVAPKPSAGADVVTSFGRP